MARFPLFAIVLLALLVGIAGTFTAASAEDKTARVPAHIIDAHIHLYDTDREQGVPWPYKDSKVLYKPHLRADFAQVAKPLGVTDVIVVEASNWVEDNQWIMDLVEGDDFYIGIVGNLDPSSDDFAKNLARFTKDPRYIGIRARSKTFKLELTPTVVKNLTLLAERDMTLDLLTGTASLDTIERLAAKIPKLRIVVNHCAGKGANGKPVDEAWQAQIHALAQHKNVYCKFSGMMSAAEQQPAPADVDYYRPLLDVLWKEFGARRMIYASDWPAINQGGDYETSLAICFAYLRPKGEEAMERVFWKNAVEVYQVKPAVETDQ